MAYPVIPLAADEYAGQKASLWRDNSSFSKMYTDPRACGINDIVTIRVSEASTASNKATLETSKKTSMSLGIDDFFGLEDQVKVNSSFTPSSMVKSSTNNSNQGEGASTRESKLTAYITARVIDVMPNSNLVIEAKKEVIVNKEKQVAVLTGIIRPRDIAYNNIIESNRIADMQIKFSGKGPVSAQTRRGWLSWLLGVIWPF
jgi:flagellar L-ring protein precursor FlgH